MSFYQINNIRLGLWVKIMWVLNKSYGKLNLVHALRRSPYSTCWFSPLGKLAKRNACLPTFRKACTNIVSTQNAILKINSLRLCWEYCSRNVLIIGQKKSQQWSLVNSNGSQVSGAKNKCENVFLNEGQYCQYWNQSHPGRCLVFSWLPSMMPWNPCRWRWSPSTDKGSWCCLCLCTSCLEGLLHTKSKMFLRSW